jgi:hypothetical protein
MVRTRSTASHSFRAESGTRWNASLPGAGAHGAKTLRDVLSRHRTLLARSSLTTASPARGQRETQKDRLRCQVQSRTDRRSAGNRGRRAGSRCARCARSRWLDPGGQRRCRPGRSRTNPGNIGKGVRACRTSQQQPCCRRKPERRGSFITVSFRQEESSLSGLRATSDCLER